MILVNTRIGRPAPGSRQGGDVKMVKFSIAQNGAQDGRRGYPKESDGVAIDLWEPVSKASVEDTPADKSRDLPSAAANDTYDQKNGEVK